MHNALYTFLCDNNFIFQESGFCKENSTETALIKINDDLLNLIWKRTGSKEWCLLTIARSHLTGRKQAVRLGGEESSEAPMEHGVFQGSILGPLFFTLCINHLPLHVSSQVDLYVDDTTLTASAHFNNLPELKISLNFSANEIRHWAVSNKLPINESKSKVLTITVEENRLVNVKSATLLALTINSSLSFDLHIENLYNKLATCIGVLRKIRTFPLLEQRLLFYNTIIFAQ